MAAPRTRGLIRHREPPQTHIICQMILQKSIPILKVVSELIQGLSTEKTENEIQLA